MLCGRLFRLCCGLCVVGSAPLTGKILLGKGKEERVKFVLLAATIITVGTIGCRTSDTALPVPQQICENGQNTAVPPSLNSEQAVRDAYEAFVERTRGVENYRRYYERPNILLSESRFAEAREAYAKAEANFFGELRDIFEAAKTVAPAFARQKEIAKQLEEGFALHATDFPRRVEEAEREHQHFCKTYGLPKTAMCIRVREADLTGDALPEHIVTYADWPKGRVPDKSTPERPNHRPVWLRIYAAAEAGELVEKARFEVGQQQVSEDKLFASLDWVQDVIKIGETPVLFQRTYSPMGSTRLFVYDAPVFRPVRLLGETDSRFPENVWRDGAFNRAGTAQYGYDYKFSDRFRVLKTMYCAYGKHGYFDSTTALREYIWNGTDYEIHREELFANFLGWKNWQQASGWKGQER